MATKKKTVKKTVKQEEPEVTLKQLKAAAADINKTLTLETPIPKGSEEEIIEALKEEDADGDGFYEGDGLKKTTLETLRAVGITVKAGSADDGEDEGEEEDEEEEKPVKKAKSKKAEPEDEPEDEEEEEDDEPEEEAPKAKKGKKEKPAKAAPEAKKAKTETAPKKKEVSAHNLAAEMLCANPELSMEKLCAALSKKNIDVEDKRHSISSTRSVVRGIVARLKANGWKPPRK